MRIFGLLPAAERRVRLPARIGLLGLAVASSSLALGPVNEQERSYNKYRTGADTAETVLTPANVESTANLFHKHFVMKVDGKIEGSPFCAFAVAMRPPTYLTILRALLRASNDVVSATGRNRANLPAANSSAPCKIAPRPQLGATLSRCASGQQACAAHRQRQQLPVIKQNSLLAAVDTLGQTDG